MASSSSSSHFPSLSNIHSDIIQTHILPKLNGPSLTAIGATSSDLRSLCNDDHLWKTICHSTYPSLADPLVSGVISTFPAGYRSIYHDSFSVLHHSTVRDIIPQEQSKIIPVPSEMISVVDIRYQEKIVYSKVELTNNVDEEVLSTPLWIEIVEPKPMDQPGFSRVSFEEPEEHENDFLGDLEKNITLNWIMIDPTLKRAGNFSSVKPIFARRHWMTNEITLRFVTILAGAGDSSEMVQCRIEVTCGGKEGEELHVREVVMQLYDMDSKCLTGKECLLTFQRAMGGERRKMESGGDVKVKYEEFLKIKKERRERREKREKRNAKVNRVIQLSAFVVGLVYVSELLFC